MNAVAYHRELKDQWDSFNRGSLNETLLINRDFMDYHSNRFSDASFIVKDDAEWKAIVPGTIVNSSWVSHAGLSYGGLVLREQFSQARAIECVSTLVEEVAQLGVQNMRVKLMPRIYYKSCLESIEFALTYLGFSLFRRDVSTSIRMAEPGKRRKGRKSAISKARREGVVVSRSTEFASFIDLENMCLREKYKTQAVHTAQEIVQLAAVFPEEIRLYTAEYEGRLIAGGLVFESPEVSHLQYFAVSPDAQHLGAGDMVIDTIINECDERQCRYFDFGISTEQGGCYLNEGLIQFKEGFGGHSTVADFYELNFS